MASFLFEYKMAVPIIKNFQKNVVMTMRKSITIQMAAMLLVACHPSYSQDSARTRFGIGVTSTGIGELFSAVARGGTAPTIYLSIRVSPRFRLEPEVGIGRFSANREMSGNITSGRKESSKTFNIGVGLFGITPKGKADFYYGARLGYIRSTTSFEFDNF